MSEKDVAVLLRVPDGINYMYRLGGGGEYFVVYDGLNGNAGLAHPCVTLPPHEAERLLRLGVALRYATQEEMDGMVADALAQKAITRTGGVQ